MKQGINYRIKSREHKALLGRKSVPLDRNVCGNRQNNNIVKA